MDIYLLDRNKEVVSDWKFYFTNKAYCGDHIFIVNDDFAHFMNQHEIDCVVSPANSYGLMDGGYDGAISAYFGDELIPSVQDYIREHFACEQPVGTSFIIQIPNTNMRLIHTPTMRVPSIIREPLIVYHCMRSTLLVARKNNVKSIVIPAFGGSCGQVPSWTIARLMRAAYEQICNPPSVMDWNYAMLRKLESTDINESPSKAFIKALSGYSKNEKK